MEERRYIKPVIEAINLPDDAILTSNNTFGEAPDETIIWPSN